jgi:pimeloyl-ACP methyl ester carboxylesterase
MIQTLPDGRLVELEAGHNVALDRPTELAETIVAFAAF